MQYGPASTLVKSRTRIPFNGSISLNRLIRNNQQQKNGFNKYKNTCILISGSFDNNRNLFYFFVILFNKINLQFDGRQKRIEKIYNKKMRIFLFCFKY